MSDLFGVFGWNTSQKFSECGWKCWLPLPVERRPARPLRGLGPAALGPAALGGALGAAEPPATPCPKVAVWEVASMGSRLWCTDSSHTRTGLSALAGQVGTVHSRAGW